GGLRQDRTLERTAIPGCEIGGSRVRAVDEIQQRRFWISCRLDDAVRQDELAKFGVIERAGWFDVTRFEAGRLRHRVGVKNGFVDSARAKRRTGSTAGPETVADDLMRIRLAHEVRAFAWRRRTSGEPRDGEVETPPEEMHWTRLAEEAAARAAENPLAVHQNLPERTDVIA